MPNKVKRKKGGLKRRRRNFRKNISKTRYNGVSHISRWCNPVSDSAEFKVDNVGLVVSDSGLLVHNTTTFAGTVSYGSMSFGGRLDDLPSHTEFTNLFEEYRIDKIVFKIVPFATMVTTAGDLSVSTTGMIVHYCIDHDDNALPAASAVGIAAMRQKQGYRVRNIYQGSGRPIVVTWRPRTTSPVYAGLVANGYTPKPLQWLDSENADVPHYGIKFIVESVSPGVVRQLFFKVEAKYYVSLKGTQ